eukprot:m.95669 g.95669  ORF g.95669 m.95669 type:complete len:849 (+) comp36860_c0_seq1:177-2723(+)
MSSESTFTLRNSTFDSICRNQIQALFCLGNHTDSVPTSDVVESLNNSLAVTLQCLGEQAITSNEVGRLISAVFSLKVQRKAVKSGGRKTYAYFGLRRQESQRELLTCQQLQAELQQERNLRMALQQRLDSETKERERLQFQVHQLQQSGFVLSAEREGRGGTSRSPLSRVSIIWKQLQEELDSELQRIKDHNGLLVTGPIVPHDRRYINPLFTVPGIERELHEVAPCLVSLLTGLGQYKEGFTPTKVLHTLSSICVLAKKNSDRVYGLQLMISLMLMARATSEKVFTVLNQLGMSLSYNKTHRFLEDIASDWQKSKALKERKWIVAYGNVNCMKRVNHESISKSSYSSNFTSRFAVEIMHIPPVEFTTDVGIAQCERSQLSVEALLPNDDDDKCFSEGAQRSVLRCLVSVVEICSHLMDVLKEEEGRSSASCIKTNIHPISVIDVDESFTDNNVIILDDFQKLLEVDDTMEQCVVGDQATCRTIRGAKRRRVADVPNSRLLWARENPGDFHFTWECLKVLFMFLWQTPNQAGSLAHLREVVNRTGVTIKAKDFQQSDEFLNNALDAHLAASVIHFVKSKESTLKEKSTNESRASLSWAKKIAEDFVRDVVSVPDDYQNDEVDHMFNFHRSFVRLGLLYRDLQEAIRREDGPRIIRHWRMWLVFFLAAKRTNYSFEAANLLANLQADFSRWLAYVVTHNRTVNAVGKYGHGKPVDMAIEHQNLIIKNALRSASANVTFNHIKTISLASSTLYEVLTLCDKEFGLSSHTTTPCNEDVDVMTRSLLDSRVVERIPSRKLRTGAHVPPEHVGYEIALGKQWVAKFLQRTDHSFEDADEEETHEECEDLPAIF